MRTLYKNAQIYASNALHFSVKDELFEALYDELPTDLFDAVIDLDGATVLPGFNDAHGHFLGLMYIARQISLAGIRTLAEVRTLFQDEPTLIRASMFNELGFETGALLDRFLLDDVRDDIPVLVLRVCGHVLMANTQAIKLIKARTGLTAGATVNFERGIFYEDAISEVMRVFLDPSQADIEADLIAAQALAFQEGITSFQTDDFITYPVPYERVIQAYQALKDTLKIRIQHQVHLKTLDALDDFLAKGYAHARFGRAVMGPSKLLVDGSLGGQTAAMHHPYVGTDNKGLLNYSKDTLMAFIERLNAHDMDLAWHAIGDRASATILDAIEHVPQRAQHRHALIHAQLTGQKEIDRMQALGVGAIIQPVFLDDDIPLLERMLGAKSQDTYLFNTLMQTVPTALSTDAPIVPLSPLKNIYHAVTRQSVKHPGEPAHLKTEALSIKDAIDGYTKMGAYFMRDALLGAIKPGFKADFTVLRGLDLKAIESFLTAEVWMTVVAGERVYHATAREAVL